MEVDSQVENKGSPCELKENGLNLYPVSLNNSGIGLPYAPEDWPNPGDKWGWKAGRRVAASGHFIDRYVYLPKRLHQAGQEKVFKSRLSLEQHIRAKYPEVDLNAFFASFSWKIPSKVLKKDNLDSSAFPRHTPRRKVEPFDVVCKADDKVCICDSLGPEAKADSDVMFCDICCSEPDFCRDCFCILCQRTISKAYIGHNYIRCEAIIDGHACGHKCHINCALRAYMAGTVGGSIGLNAEYYCRRCDSKTDLVSHVRKLLDKCEPTASRNDILKVLDVGISVLRKSNKASAEKLLQQIESTVPNVHKEW